MTDNDYLPRDYDRMFDPPENRVCPECEEDIDDCECEKCPECGALWYGSPCDECGHEVTVEVDEGDDNDE